MLPLSFRTHCKGMIFFRTEIKIVSETAKSVSETAKSASETENQPGIKEIIGRQSGLMSLFFLASRLPSVVSAAHLGIKKTAPKLEAVNINAEMKRLPTTRY